MKKVIDGAVYNTKTAKKICEQISEGLVFEQGSYAKKLKQLFKTRSGKYFFYIERYLEAPVSINNDDLNPIFEETEVIDCKIIPIDYKLALEFASEVSADVDLKSKERIAKYFPQIIEGKMDENIKIQKKFYLSKKAVWYLEMMLTESEETNSSIVEKLIVKEYKRLYKKGIMNNDPYFEMED